MEKFIKTIRKQYAEIIEALREAEKQHNEDRRSVKKREIFQFIAAQEIAINDLCTELGIELVDKNFDLIQ